MSEASENSGVHVHHHYHYYYCNHKKHFVQRDMDFAAERNVEAQTASKPRLLFSSLRKSIHRNKDKKKLPLTSSSPHSTLQVLPPPDYHEKDHKPVSASNICDTFQLRHSQRLKQRDMNIKAKPDLFNPPDHELEFLYKV